jgi:YD repeat-containing protein
VKLQKTFFMRVSKFYFLLVIFMQAIAGRGQDVNLFTGSGSYGVPLFEVPSNKGRSISLGASYQAGIQVKQRAGEIGLGWALSGGGAISRNICGIPDDINGESFFDETSKSFLAQNGLLYGCSHWDQYRTEKNQDSTDFMFPNYDQYSVVGPGISGNMTPNILDFQAFTQDGSGHYSVGSSGISPRPVQFRFKNDFFDTLVSRHYSVTPISGSTARKIPGEHMAGNGYTSSPQPYIGKKVSGASILNENFDMTTNRLGTSHYIEYFTNSQMSALTSTNYPGVIDFQSTHTRTSTSFPSDGIGGFRVTTPSGYVYHYSLPVYINKQETHNYPLDKDYSVPSYNLSTYTTSANYHLWSQNGAVVTKYKTEVKYAYQWLLTAITGPDYEDSNNNHYLDDSDEGYWVSFNYEKWAADFAERSPQYGFNYFFGLDEATKHLPASLSYTSTPYYKLSGKSGTVNMVWREIYYLNKIKTTSHSAIFVRDVRNDDVSSHTTTTITAAIAPTPQLKLTRIALFKNDRLDSIISSAPSTTFATTSYTNFSFSGTNNAGNIYNESWFNANLNSTIKNRVLKHSEFTQDYSLCRNYHGNVGVTSVTTSVVSPPATVQNSLSVVTYSTSGKLTLTKITAYELQNQKVSPSVQFTYNQSNSTDNPDYDPKYEDYWGYYKSDVTSNAYSGYTSSTSKDNSDAWSLRSIIEPLGAKTEFEYESNSYKSVLHKNGTEALRGPAFVYPINSLAVSSNTLHLDMTMEESTNPTEFLSLLTSTIAGITKNICLPMSYTSTTTFTDVAAYQRRILTGTFTATGSNSPYTITSVYKSCLHNGSNPDCYTDNVTGGHTPSNGFGDRFEIPGDCDFIYSGNGYVFFQTLVGTEAYGGGIRIKKIKRTNITGEEYVTEYTYEDGAATNEADRFEYPRYKAMCGASDLFINKHEPLVIDKHSLGLSIGYGKVTVKNLGRANTANGSVVTEFITSNKTISGSFIDNFTMQAVYNYTNSTCLKECIDKFTYYWGQKKEERTYDINNNMMTKTVFEYENTDQGALVENFNYNSTHPIYPYTTSILREYPVVLKKTKNYGIGVYTESECIKLDENTGEDVIVRTKGQNGSTTLSYNVPAFRLSTFANMGPKSVNSSYKNILHWPGYSLQTVDTTLVTTTNNVSQSFFSSTAKVFTTQATVRTYSASAFIRLSTSLDQWYNSGDYSWIGVINSADQFGLYKRSELASNPFNFSSPYSSSSHWRMMTEPTLFDERLNLLESRTFNNRFSATKYGYNNDLVIAKCPGSNYPSFTYSGFESVMPNTSSSVFADGEIHIQTGIGATLVPTSTITPHTGYQCLSATSSGGIYRAIFSNNGTYETGVQPGRMYRVIVWVSTSSPNQAYIKSEVYGVVSGSSYSSTATMYANDANAITIGNWKKLSFDFEVPEGITTSGGTDVAITIGVLNGYGTAYFDDLMFYPVESTLNANVYNYGTGRVVAKLDALGFSTLYTYDAEGKVLETYREIPGVGTKLVQRNSYNYSRTD